MTEEQARAKAEEGGWADKVAVQKTSFKANSKALAEKESEGIAKMIYRRVGVSEHCCHLGLFTVITMAHIHSTAAALIHMPSRCAVMCEF